MKNIIFSVLFLPLGQSGFAQITMKHVHPISFLMPGHKGIAPKNIGGVSVLLKGDFDTPQNIIGLSLVEFVIINNAEAPKSISRPENWEFLATVNGVKMVLTPCTLGSFDVHYIFLGPHDTLRLKANLDLFQLLEYDKTIVSHLPQSITVCAQIGGKDGTQKYVSPDYTIMINPLEEKDQAAFDFLQKSDYQVHKITCGAVIMNYKFDFDMVQTIFSKYPESTFAALAALNLAYSKYRNAPTDMAQRAEILRLLKAPLDSKYGYVRYLSNELLAQLNGF